MILRWKKGAVNQPHRYFTIWRHDLGGIILGRLLVVLAGKGPSVVFRGEGKGPSIVFRGEGKGPSVVFRGEGKGPSIAFTGKRAGADFT